jgi:hypothetical protein
MRPAVGITSPEIADATVDLPAPLVPSTASTDPGGSVNDTSATARVIPNSTTSPCTDSSGRSADADAGGGSSAAAGPTASAPAEASAISPAA